VSAEVMTKSRIWFLSWVGKLINGNVTVIGKVVIPHEKQMEIETSYETTTKLNLRIGK